MITFIVCMHALEFLILLQVCEIKAQGIDNSTQTHCAILTYFDLTEGTSLPFMNPLYRNRLKISTKCLCDMHVYEVNEDG